MVRIDMCDIEKVVRIDMCGLKKVMSGKNRHVFRESGRNRHV